MMSRRGSKLKLSRANHALQRTRPSRLWLQSWRPVGRVAELGSFGQGAMIRWLRSVSWRTSEGLR